MRAIAVSRKKKLREIRRENKRLSDNMRYVAEIVQEIQKERGEK
jgi:uncharacterized protein YjfI (DUF2170 family)